MTTMGHAFSPSHCKQCGSQLPQQHTGRPGEYCGTKCRQAAHRRRHSNPPGTEKYDRYLREELGRLEDDVKLLRHLLDVPDSAPEEPLRLLVQLQRRAAYVERVMVGRTKVIGASWETIGALVGSNKDSARKKYTPEMIQRALNRHASPALPSAAPVQRRPSSPPATGGPPASPPPPGEEPLTHSPHAKDLAQVLSGLQKASRQSLRDLSRSTGLSPSFLSRLMSGERFPTWKSAASIAQACGAEPGLLRKVWEDAEARRYTGRTTNLASALRYLHMRAGSPSPWAMEITSSHTLPQDHITALLDGTTTGTWDDVLRLIQILDGEPAYFQPLWETQTRTPQTSLPPSPPPPPPRPPTEPAQRLENLFFAFNDTFPPTRYTPPIPQRRPLPTPITALTRWPRP
ncbi:helix-turn-helix domain-containing protein [Streptomyces sp. 35G-GA-8]|uniref:helix-turn-helix domain-containing protein n=1 Tax=Streptomyces sp. 35G-GA-8 TaxID=2939434 RepID=UPI00201F35B9|nr:helix-turn-helix domain-containing protein [Streptomyces sp. 35G-GA-8]MCL7382224.1 helix-turn-helix domain-containing protein [Streptomyces sp. 35G-GA-8]